jgi:hypothetical protein
MLLNTAKKQQIENVRQLNLNLELPALFCSRLPAKFVDTEQGKYSKHGREK